MTIRRTLEDFFVDERIDAAWRARLLDAPTPAAPHAVFVIEKTSLTTPEAAQLVAKELSVRHADMHYAGLKDKHARTVQHASTLTRDAAHARDLPKSISGRNWSARLLGFSPEPISAECIHRNHFRIVVRDLSKQASDEMDRRAELLCEVEGPARALVFVNYFGDQRFGSARHGEGFVAAHLIRGEFEQALRLAIGTPARKDSVRRTFTRVLASRWGDWPALANDLPKCPEKRAIEHLSVNPTDFRGAFSALPMFTQQMCVEAFQSHLWNAVARDLAQRVADEFAPDSAQPVRMPTPEYPRVRPPRPRLVLLRTPDPFGEMLFPSPGAVDADWRAVDMPLLARGTILTEPFTAAAAQVLQREGLTLDDLRIPGMRRPYFGEAQRRLFVAADGFTMSAPEHDDMTTGKRLKRELEFDLPRGSYATVLLRALGQ